MTKVLSCLFEQFCQYLFTLPSCVIKYHTAEEALHSSLVAKQTISMNQLHHFCKCLVWLSHPIRNKVLQQLLFKASRKISCLEINYFTMLIHFTSQLLPCSKPSSILTEHSAHSITLFLVCTAESYKFTLIVNQPLHYVLKHNEEITFPKLIRHLTIL